MPHRLTCARDGNEILSQHAHRPYPLPDKSWVMRQEWHQLLFAHWRLEAEVVRRMIPCQLELDLWRGHAYLAITPFMLRCLRARALPAFPVISHFSEVNVRTYVTYQGVPGVFFFSLDAGNFSAVIGARLLYRLPYHKAVMHIEMRGSSVHYHSQRVHGPKPAELEIAYRPTSSVLPWTSPSESLERFLTERYCLYAVSGKQTFRAHIHHGPVALQNAEAVISRNTMAAPLRLDLSCAPDLIHYSTFLDVLIWPVELAR